MKKINFNKDWQFILDNNLDGFATYGFLKYSAAIGPTARIYDHSNWERVDLPHDWAVGLEVQPTSNVFKGARLNSKYANAFSEMQCNCREVYSVGWYRKQFELSPEWEGKRVFLQFEGVFRDATVWVNGSYMTRHTSGYTGFEIDITDHLFWGEINSVAVRADSSQPEGWWYEGSGIYRNVWLRVAEETYALTEKTAIETALNGEVAVKTAIVTHSDNGYDGELEWKIKDKGGEVVCCYSQKIKVQPCRQEQASCVLNIDKPKLWDLDSPYLYTLEICVGGDVTAISFGVRTVEFDADKGFLLNAKPCKIYGACNHQDFGGVGVALSDNLNFYKIKRLKEMGLNAYRTSHHAPSPALLDACDRLGMLVMDETRMFGTSPEAEAQLTQLIERDRNHPCVFIWSLGNEEFDVQNVPISYRLMQNATKIAKRLDPTRAVTYGGNNASNFVGANGASEVRGVNYIRNKGEDLPGKHWIDVYHEKHPNQPIIGTENTSYVLSRGDTVNDLGSGRIDCFGNVTMMWGSTAKGWLKFTDEREFLAGGFIWTGFDYRGEPNPFVYTNFSSSFGTIDLCGMEKPPFYYYKAWCTNQPVLKLAAHWNFSEGELARVAVFTNCESVTLYVNGRVVAEKEVERYDLPQFDIPFEAGVIEAVGVKGGVKHVDKMVTSGKASGVVVRSELIGQGADDVSIFEINALDEKGNFCPLASNYVDIEVQNGQIVGVGSGNPASTDPEQYKPTQKTLLINKFNYSNGLYSVPQKASNRVFGRYDYIEREQKIETFEDDFRLVAKYAYSLEPDKTEEFTTTVNLTEDYEYIEFERLGGNTTLYVDGKEVANTSREQIAQRPYRFYHDFKAGTHQIKVVVTTKERGNEPISGYVIIGKSVAPNWQVGLHFGKARVMVKSDCHEKIKLTAKLK